MPPGARSRRAGSGGAPLSSFVHTPFHSASRCLSRLAPQATASQGVMVARTAWRPALQCTGVPSSPDDLRYVLQYRNIGRDRARGIGFICGRGGADNSGEGGLAGRRTLLRRVQAHPVHEENPAPWRYRVHVMYPQSRRKRMNERFTWRPQVSRKRCRYRETAPEPERHRGGRTRLQAASSCALGSRKLMEPRGPTMISVV